MSQPDTRIVSPPVRFSESPLWRKQQAYFEQGGLALYGDAVPNFITSNAATAKQVALLVYQHMVAVAKEHPQLKFDIVEIGAGDGRFAHACCLALESLTKLLKQDEALSQKEPGIDWTYWITDGVKDNLDHFALNPFLAPLLQAKRCQLSLWHEWEQTPYDWQDKSQSVPWFEDNHYPIFIAQYVLDCLPQDLFETNEQGCFPVNVALQSAFRATATLDELPMDEVKLSLTTTADDLSVAPYDCPILGKVFDNLVETLPHCRWLLPVGAINLLKTLHGKAKHNGFACLIGDKCLLHPFELDHYPSYNHDAFDGCYNFTVNGHALEIAMRALNGDTANIESYDLLDYKFQLHASHTLAPSIKLNLSQLSLFGPNDLVERLHDIPNQVDRLDFHQIYSLIKQSHFDVTIFALCYHRIEALYPDLPQLHLEMLQDAVKKVTEALYATPYQDQYPLLKLAQWYELDENHVAAVDVYEKLIMLFPDTPWLLESLMNCYQTLGQSDKAKQLQNRKAALAKTTDITPPNGTSRQRNLRVLGLLMGLVGVAAWQLFFK